MGNAPDERPDADGPADDAADGDEGESLRRRVEERYDFEDFGASDMAEMSLEEWTAAFDPETWVTGDALLDRVEAELRARVADGQLFAVVERHTVDGDDGLLAYTDAEYAVVRPDGTVEGDAGLRRDVEPVVALCSMADYDVAEPPADAGLPDPERVEPGAGGLGHRLLLAVAGVQLVAGLVLLVAPLVVRIGAGAGALTTVVGLGFVVIGVVLGLLVANARLSDRFRAAEYRERLRAAGVGSDERPSFLPPLGGDAGGRDPAERDAE